MVCQADEEALMENLRCTRAWREKRTPESWLEVVFTGLAGCQQRLRLRRAFRDKEAKEKLPKDKEPKSRDGHRLCKVLTEARRKVNLEAEGTEEKLHSHAALPSPHFTPSSRPEVALVLAQPLCSKQEIKKCVYLSLKRKTKEKQSKSLHSGLQE